MKPIELLWFDTSFFFFFDKVSDLGLDVGPPLTHEMSVDVYVSGGDGGK